MSSLFWHICKERWKLSSLLTLEEVDLYLNDQIHVYLMTWGIILKTTTWLINKYLMCCWWGRVWSCHQGAHCRSSSDTRTHRQSWKKCLHPFYSSKSIYYSYIHSFNPSCSSQASWRERCRSKHNKHTKIHKKTTKTNNTVWIVQDATTRGKIPAFMKFL